MSYSTEDEAIRKAYSLISESFRSAKLRRVRILPCEGSDDGDGRGFKMVDDITGKTIASDIDLDALKDEAYDKGYFVVNDPEEETDFDDDGLSDEERLRRLEDIYWEDIRDRMKDEED